MDTVEPTVTSGDVLTSPAPAPAPASSESDNFSTKSEDPSLTKPETQIEGFLKTTSTPKTSSKSPASTAGRTTSTARVESTSSPVFIPIAIQKYDVVNASNVSVVIMKPPEEKVAVPAGSTNGKSVGSNLSPAAIVLPVLFAVFLVAAIILFVVFIRAKKKFKRRGNKKSPLDGRQSFPPVEEGGDSVPIIPNNPDDLYAKVDRSKKRKPNAGQSGDEIPLNYIITSSHPLLSETPEEGGGSTYALWEEHDDATTGYSTYNTNDNDSTTFIENELYEAGNYDDDDHYSNASAEHQYESADSLHDKDSVRDSILVPIPKDGPSSDSDSDFEDLPDNAPVPENYTEKANEVYYLKALCHNHPQRGGPDWKPYREYDPVYVPQDHPSRQIENFIDKNNYITGRQRSDTLNPYEEVLCGAQQGPTIILDIDPQESPEVAESGAEDTSEVPPAVPPHRVSSHQRAASVEREVPPATPKRRESMLGKNNSWRRSLPAMSNACLAPVVEKEQRYSDLFLGSTNDEEQASTYTSLQAQEAYGDTTPESDTTTAVAAGAEGTDQEYSPVDNEYESVDMEGESKDEVYEPVEFVP